MAEAAAAAQAAQERQLQNARKIASRAPRFNPNVTAWRTFRSTYTSWSNMSGISAMGEAGAAPAHIEFTKLCLESAMEGTAVDRVEQFRVGTAAAAPHSMTTSYYWKAYFNLPNSRAPCSKNSKVTSKAKMMMLPLTSAVSARYMMWRTRRTSATTRP